MESLWSEHERVENCGVTQIERDAYVALYALGVLLMALPVASLAAMVRRPGRIVEWATCIASVVAFVALVVGLVAVLHYVNHR